MSVSIEAHAHFEVDINTRVVSLRDYIEAVDIQVQETYDFEQASACQRYLMVCEKQRTYYA